MPRKRPLSHPGPRIHGRADTARDGVQQATGSRTLCRRLSRAFPIQTLPTEKPLALSRKPRMELRRRLFDTRCRALPSVGPPRGGKGRLLQHWRCGPAIITVGVANPQNRGRGRSSVSRGVRTATVRGLFEGFATRHFAYSLRPGFGDLERRARRDATAGAKGGVAQTIWLGLP